jgi:hypothetical protein
MPVRAHYNYTRVKQQPEDFPYRHLMRLERVEALPEEVMLNEKPWYFPAYDQGRWGSCTAQAAVAVKTYITRRYIGEKYADPARMGFYYCERMVDGNVHDDTGSDGRTSALVMMKTGVGSESLWPYEDRFFNREPNDSAAYFREAAAHKIGAFYFLNGEYQIKKCLAAGYPFVLGIYVPQQLQDDAFDGILPMCTDADIIYENGQAAGHQISCFGYKQINGELHFLMRNSWGTDWGLKDIPGHFWMPSRMVTSDWVDACITYRLAKEPSI